MKIAKSQLRRIIKEELSNIMEDDRGLQAGEERNNAVSALGSVTSNQQIIDIISNLSNDALWGQQTMKDAESGEDPSGWGDPWGSVLAFAGLPSNVLSSVSDAIGLERQASLDQALGQSDPSDFDVEAPTPSAPTPAPEADITDMGEKPEGDITSLSVPEPASDEAEDTGDLARGDYTLQDYEREMNLVKESFRRFLK